MATVGSAEPQEPLARNPGAEEHQGSLQLLTCEPAAAFPSLGISPQKWWNTDIKHI